MTRILSCILFSVTVACGGTAGGGDKAEQAAAIAKELRAKPDDAEKILGQHDMTPDQWEALMYDVASDPALAAKYEAALAK